MIGVKWEAAPGNPIIEALAHYFGTEPWCVVAVLFLILFGSGWVIMGRSRGE